MTYLCKNSPNVPGTARNFESKFNLFLMKKAWYQIPKSKRDPGISTEQMSLRWAFFKWNPFLKSSKLERLFCHVSLKRDVRALSFELLKQHSKMSPQVGSAVKAKSFGEDPRATGGLVSWLPHPRFNKTKQHTTTLLELHYVLQVFCVRQEDGRGVNRGS